MGQHGRGDAVQGRTAAPDAAQADLHTGERIGLRQAAAADVPPGDGPPGGPREHFPGQRGGKQQDGTPTDRLRQVVARVHMGVEGTAAQATAQHLPVRAQLEGHQRPGGEQQRRQETAQGGCPPGHMSGLPLQQQGQRPAAGQEPYAQHRACQGEELPGRQGPGDPGHERRQQQLSCRSPEPGRAQEGRQGAERACGRGDQEPLPWRRMAPPAPDQQEEQHIRREILQKDPLRVQVHPSFGASVAWRRGRPLSNRAG